MNIKDAEKATGVSVRNIRFYEQKGLLTPNRNKGNDYREYSDADIRRLQLIRALRMVDMPLERIREVVDGEVSLHDAAAAQKEKLEDQIKHLKVVIKFCGELSETEPENVKEVLERMDKPENKKIFSKEWRTDYADKLKKIGKQMALAAAVLGIAVVLAFFRYVYYAVPSWAPLPFGIQLQMISSGLLSNRFILPDLLFWPIAYRIFVLFQEGSKRCRYVIRPLVALLVILILSSYAIESNASWEDDIWDNHVEEFNREISDFLDEADEVVLYGVAWYRSSYVEDQRIKCHCGEQHDALMIDYDTKSIAFYNHGDVDHFYVFPMQPGALTEKNSFVQLDTLLPDSGTRLITYYPDEDSSHRTCALEVIFSDGTVYSTVEMSDGYWEDTYLDITGAIPFRVGDPHPVYEYDNE